MSKPLYLQALDSLRKREWLLRVLIFTLVTIVFWIGFSIYRSQTQSKISIDIKKHTEPLNPNINRTVLEELGQRQRYLDGELLDFPLYEIVLDEEGRASLREVGSGPLITIESSLGSTATAAATPAQAEETPAETPPVEETPTATESAVQPAP